MRDAGAAPCAIDDTTVAAGATISIDVLANDVDNIGAGLTINAVTSGSCTIVGGQLQYTQSDACPDTETCTYSVIDGNGTPQVSLADGTVTITCA